MKRLSAIFLCLTLVFTLFTGCSSETSNSSTNEVSDTDVSNSENETGEPETVTFPLDEPIELEYWLAFSSTHIKTLSENAFYQDLEEKTNIHINWNHPPQGQEQDQFSLMIASDDLPDIICWSSYPGGYDKAISDGVYVKLNDYIQKYAPNYSRVINSNPDILKQVTTDSGSMAGMFLIQIAEEPAWNGLVVRGDWLEDLNMDPPKTIDDWHTMLTRFKEEKGAEAPLLISFDWQMEESAHFLSAYNVTYTFFNQDGTVKYGPMEPGYKEFLTTMKQWFDEGLIDRDFVTRDDASKNAYFTSGKSGAIPGNYGTFDAWNSAGKAIDPNYSLYGTESVSLNPDDETHFRCTNYYNKGSETFFTTSNEHLAESIAMFDLGFVEENFPTYNYGVEGVSWEWEEGPIADISKPFWPESLRDSDEHPAYNEFMTNNPDGIPFWDLVNSYKPFYLPYLRDPMANEMSDDVIQAMNAWTATGNDWMIPAKMTNTEEENAIITPLLNDITTYRDEMVLKFITGEEPLENFDAYVETLKDMGIEEVIELKQAALDRYLAR